MNKYTIIYVGIVIFTDRAQSMLQETKENEKLKCKPSANCACAILLIYGLGCVVYSLVACG